MHPPLTGPAPSDLRVVYLDGPVERPEKEAEWAADPFRLPDPADLPPFDVSELLRRTGLGPTKGAKR